MYSQDVGDPAFKAVISAHRNFVDYTPFTLIILTLCGFHAINTLWYGLLCLSLLIGRYIHAIGLIIFEQKEKPNYQLRVWGMMLTLNSILLGALTLLIKSL